MNSSNGLEDLNMLLFDAPTQFDTMDEVTKEIESLNNNEASWNMNNTSKSDGLEDALQNQNELMYAMSSQLALTKLQMKKALAQRESVSEEFMKMSETFERQSQFLNSIITPLKERQTFFQSALDRMQTQEMKYDQELKKIQKDFINKIDELKGHLSLIESKAAMIAEKSDLYNLEELLQSSQKNEKDAINRASSLSETVIRLTRKLQEEQRQKIENEETFNIFKERVHHLNTTVTKQATIIQTHNKKINENEKYIEELKRKVLQLTLESQDKSKEIERQAINSKKHYDIRANEAKVKHDAIILSVLEGRNNDSLNITDNTEMYDILEQKVQVLQRQVNQMHKQEYPQSSLKKIKHQNNTNNNNNNEIIITTQNIYNKYDYLCSM